uniref:NADP-dependent oxidoreductase domain-containing protein n=1 Tax=Cucumis sativus TaxID=3659 RepID=A0A0A0LKS7_CUCSA
MEGKPQKLIQIPRVKLGSQGLEVSRLGFGCAGLSGSLNSPLSHEEGCKIIKQAFIRGVTFFYSSDIYGADHDNEIMIGKALKQLPREKIQLATKFGIVPLGGLEFAVNGTPEYVRKCCEASLERLQVDYIDLYYQHRIDANRRNFYLLNLWLVDVKMGELKKLVEEGKIKYIGLSEASANTIRRAHAVRPITVIQMEELGNGIVAYSPLGRGFFGGKATAESLPSKTSLAYHPRFSKESLEQNEAVYRRFASVAVKHGYTTVQLALAWLLHQGIDIVPIPGTTKLGNLDSNIESLDVKLTEEDFKEIGDAVPVDEVRGQREYDVLTKYMWKFADTPLRT